MKAAGRALRDAQVVGLFLAGGSYRSIARAVGLKSHHTVSAIVERSFAGPSSSQRRELLTDEAFALWQERTERLFRAHWAPALEGNVRSAEVCRKLLAHMAQVYGLQQEVSLAGTRADAVEVEPEPDPDGDEVLDVLERMRRDRARAELARTSG